MRDGSKLSWLLAAESAIILVLPFPVAGPLPHWRAELAYIALVPLLITLLFRRRGFGWSRVARNTLVGYFGGVLWYAGTCYWIQSTMHLYGNMSSPMSWLVLFLFLSLPGTIFRSIRVVAQSCPAGHGKHGINTRHCAIFMGGDGACVRKNYQLSMEPAWLFADR